MELIDRAALGVGRCSKDILPAAYCAGWNGLLNIINDAPTIDAMPVVRCQECKHKNTTACPAYDAPFMRTSLRIKFCSEGQRREDNHEVSE